MSESITEYEAIYNAPETVLTPEDYNQAIIVQDACNLSGVAHDFSKVVTKVWQEAHEHGKGTDWVNQHPIVRMWVDKLASLAGVQFDSHCAMNAFSIAYRKVRRHS